MKKNIINIYNLKNIVILTLSVLIIGGCYQYPEFDDLSYNEYKRVIGPEGGVINFYRNYENDSLKDIAVKMEFPENAVDSLLIFNMYEFFDEVTYYDLIYELNREQFSDFLYFVPFDEKEGYTAVVTDSTDIYDIIENHISIDFHSAVTVTYYNSFYENIPESTNLYRIKIPAEDEWGDENNVWVSYNYQGYPDGYDDIDLTYLINGRWSENIEWGTGQLSLINWEEVPEFTFNSAEQTVTFDIYSTDYMYVMALDILK